MTNRIAWVLNFDADEELASPVGYTPSPAMLAREGDLVVRVESLVSSRDVILATTSGPLDIGYEYVGRAWCPTPRALRILRDANVRIPQTPSVDVLRQVNHRRFCANLGQFLPGARYVTSLEDVEAAVEAPSPGGAWLLKRPFGFAGRGRLKVSVGALDARGRAWVAASLRSGEGLQVEPWVDRRGDFALHGWVSRSGEIFLGHPTVQVCDHTGAWRCTLRASAVDLGESERNALIAAGNVTGRALHRIFYFGPFGIDAFRWEDSTDGVRFNPRSEINARYTMGWAVGMGALRPDLEEE